jgi:hypothetical protein
MDWNDFSKKLNDKMDKTFRPNAQWMAEKYEEMNQQLFNGELGACSFAIFTSGRGSEGGVLGWFKITARNIRIDRYSRRMFANYGFDRTYIDKSNFVDLCRPQIELNGNYTGTEHSFLATLAHEMCHYYTYMNGYAPKQGHGREFKDIGSIVSYRSNGMFTIQRLASAEQMTEMELSDEMKAKRAKRLANKKSSVTAIIVFTKEGKVKLTMTSSQSLINMISTSEEERGDNVVTTNDAEIIEYLFGKGYRKNMRTWRYWSLEDKPWLGELKGMLPETSGETLGVKRPAAQQVPPQQPKLIFSIKTSNGIFETECSSYVELRNKLQQRFPNMSYETITKLMNNKANFKTITESKMDAKSIIKEVIEEFMNTEMGDDSVAINPDMNLGLQSPLEGE